MSEEEKKKPEPKEPQVYAADSVYIDPIDCDSTVSYKVVGHKSYLEAAVTLADCSHKIQWNFSNTEDALGKVDLAIGMLTAFRRAFVKARKDYKPKKGEEEY
jgi:hypothetical protein